MSEINGLLKEYEKFVTPPWPARVAAQQRVWCAVYDPSDERRLRLRLGDFERVTRQANHGWLGVDLTDGFSSWLAGLEYRDAYFEAPDDLDVALDEFIALLSERITEAVQGGGVGPGDVVALYGLASLFGFASVSKLIEEVAPQVEGRLLVFFPGHHDASNYRLLDARDGWNYHAVPITSQGGL